MIYIVLMPLLLLLMPASVTGIFISFAAFLVIGMLIRQHLKKRTFGNGAAVLEMKSIVETVIAAFLFGCMFYARWVSSSEVRAIASIFSISVQLFVGVVAALLSCAAIWSMNWLLRDAKNVLGDTYSLALPIRDQLADKLGRSDWLLCAGLALGGVIVFCNTCPFFKISQGRDASVFLYIGREMLHGKIPYVDLFDHKGIILYLIQYIGFLLSVPGTYSGVWFIEWLGLFITVIFMYKTVRMLSTSKFASYLILLIIVFIYTSRYYEGGNLTETYALPWIAMAVYIYLKFFMISHYRPIEVVALGVGCAVVAFLRVNMIGLWLAFTPLVIFFLMKERRFSEIIRCISWFVGGLAIVCIPLGIYFILTDSLGDMLKYYIQFNMSYTGSRASAANQLNAILVLGSGLHIITAIFAVMTYRYIRFKKVFWINMWGLVISMYFVAMSGRPYGHYGLILVPLLLIPVMCVALVAIHYLKATNIFTEDSRVRKLFRNRQKTLVALTCLAILIMLLPKLIQSNSDKSDPVIEYLSKETDESDDVLIIGNDVHYYLETERKTENKFFYQRPPITVSDELYGEFLQELTYNQSDIILFFSKEFKEFDEIDKLQDCLNQWCEEGKYAYEDFGFFDVYRLKETA